MTPIADMRVPSVEDAEIHADAVRDEPAWEMAHHVEGPFVVLRPSAGSPPVGPTDVWVITDERALYIFAEVTDPEPERIRASIGRRDTRRRDDGFAVYIDPTGEAQRAYVLQVNAAGIQYDATQLSATDEESASWNAVWSSQVRRTETGYEVELVIPWRAIRHPRNVDQLGLLFERYVARLGEVSTWPAIDLGKGFLMQEGMFAGPGRLPRSTGLDLLPELSFGWTDQGLVETLFSYQGLSAGATVRYSPLPSLSLVGTVNPDFSQVEADAAQISVNRRDALFLEEKRPFFLDGQEWFQHPFDSLVATRSVVSPYGGLRFTVEPKNALIAGLFALDATPPPSVNGTGGWTEEDVAGHESAVSVIRARRSIGKDGYVGLLLSDRTLVGSELSNQVAALDTRLRMSSKTTVTLAAVGSRTVFSDGSTRLAPGGSLNISRGGQNAYYGIWSKAVAPDFRAENGFITGSDYAGAGFWTGVNIFPKSALVPRVTISPLNLNLTQSFSDDLALASVFDPRLYRASLFELSFSPNLSGDPLWEGRLFNLQFDGQQLDGRLRDVSATTRANVVFSNGLQSEVWGTTGGLWFSSSWLPRNEIGANVGGQLTRWLEIQVNASGGRAPLYDWENPNVGDGLQGWSEVVFRPAPMFSIGVRGSYEQLLVEDRVQYAGWVGRLRSELFLSRRLSGRAIVDRDAFSDSWRTEGMMVWERSPGTGVYLGGSRLVVLEPRDQSWTVFAKVAFAFSPGI